MAENRKSRLENDEAPPLAWWGSLRPGPLGYPTHDEDLLRGGRTLLHRLPRSVGGTLGASFFQIKPRSRVGERYQKADFRSGTPPPFQDDGALPFTGAFGDSLTLPLAASGNAKSRPHRTARH